MEWTTAGVQSRLHGMRRLSAQPLSSDEGAESGEDSEEDMVTNYLPGGGGAQGATTSPHRHPPPLYHTHHHTHHHPQQHQQPAHGSVQPPHGHPGRRLVRMAEIPTMDSVSSGDPMGPSSGGYGPGGTNYPHGAPPNSHTPSIPIISITPHSPVVNKPFAVLEDNIRQLQSVQENIQRMRDAGLSVKNSRSLSRLSSSCPSLNVEGEGDPTSSPYSPWSEEFLLDARKGGGADNSRRRSWSGLSDTEKKRARQRSVSLSSFDSDGEEPFYDAEEHSHPRASDAGEGMGRDKPRSLSGGSSPGAAHPRGCSTHSLNDVHLDKGGVVAAGHGGPDKPRLLAPRLTLQKSISTPSILANITAAQQPQQPTDEEDQASTKRRKRGSIFFRKKKDKSRKTCHQFVSVCFSNSATCDVCAKPMVNKPALRCEACQVCVHEHSCRDHISDCSKLKTSKGFPKPGTPLSAATKSSSLGSNPSSGSSSILSSGVLGHSSSVATRARSAVGHSSSPTRPHSLIASNTRAVNEDKEGGDALQEAADNNILDTNSASMESLDDASEEPAPSSSSTLDDIDGDPDLRLLEKEPELWVHTVDQATVDNLTDRQVKKQEHIYELIITEKHHCRMLRVMQKVFVAGMTRELGMSQNRIRRVFPCLDELLTLHCSFLWRLRQRQRENRYIATIGDLLLEQFVGDNAQGLKDAYGVFCSHHQDAVSYFKELCKTDRRFNAFIIQRYSHPLMKKKGIPECILFMTHRITKYPLMIEAIIKYSRDQEEESATLRRALDNIKEILVNINSQVAEKERKQRLLEIYHKIDAKSSTTYKDLKFKKSDLLNNSRTLKFEGSAVLLQQRGKPLLVQVVVMSDLVFFVHENNQKYYFVSPDNKAGAIPLEKLLIREKAGDNTRAIYFIHKKNQAEMFEMECQHPKDKKIWFCSIREAVEQCPDEDDTSDGTSVSTVTANAEKLRHLLATLQHKDRDIAQLCEEKEACMVEILAEWGGHSQDLVTQSPQLRSLLDELSVDPSQARHLQIKSLTDALKLVSGACGWGSGLARSVSSVGEHQSDAYVSPSLPKRAETFGGFDNSNKDGTAAAGTTAAAGATATAASPNSAAGPASAQPQTKAAPSAGKKKKDPSRISPASVASADAALADTSELSVSKRLAANARRPSASLLTPRASQDNLSLMSGVSSDVSTVVGSAQDLAHQQQENAAKLMNCLHIALVLSQHHVTQYEMLLRGSGLSGNSEARFRHSQKLEELRNIQEQISLERHSYAKDRDTREKWLQDKADRLNTLEETLKAAEDDVIQQRDLLYRQLEALKSEGIILSPSLNVFFNSGGPSPSSLKGDASGSSHNSPTGAIPATRPHKTTRNTPPVTKRDSSSALPTHLISATNQQKGPVSVKQQLPMKLAKLGSGGSSSSSSSMSSSLGGSMGGSMSPSQEHRTSPNVSHMSRGSVGTSVTQILPLKLSESLSESRKGPGGYQRLHSPPPPVGDEAGNPSTHHRTGSSPATLQNGSPSGSSPVPDVAAGILGAGSVSGGVASGGQKAARTNTYPKLANKPALLPASGTGSLGAREGGNVAAQHQFIQQQQQLAQLQQQQQLLQQQQLMQQQQLLQQQQQQQQVSGVSVSNTRPGQRIKDPDTNEDIIFF